MLTRAKYRYHIWFDNTIYEDMFIITETHRGVERNVASGPGSTSEAFVMIENLMILDRAMVRV